MRVDTWGENADAMREAAKIVDQEALSVLTKKDIEIVTPKQNEIKERSERFAKNTTRFD